MRKRIGTCYLVISRLTPPQFRGNPVKHFSEVHPFKVIGGPPGLFADRNDELALLTIALKCVVVRDLSMAHSESVFDNKMYWLGRPLLDAIQDLESVLGILGSLREHFERIENDLHDARGDSLKSGEEHYLGLDYSRDHYEQLSKEAKSNDNQNEASPDSIFLVDQFDAWSWWHDHTATPGELTQNEQLVVNTLNDWATKHNLHFDGDWIIANGLFTVSYWFFNEEKVVRDRWAPQNVERQAQYESYLYSRLEEYRSFHIQASNMRNEEALVELARKVDESEIFSLARLYTRLLEPVETKPANFRGLALYLFTGRSYEKVTNTLEELHMPFRPTKRKSEAGDYSSTRSSVKRAAWELAMSVEQLNEHHKKAGNLSLQ